ncbi:cytochrome c [Sandarakinorhabdus rubra]|uniref:cytochrome c n=1 Tax=Sandarakinorhabdus rubra TaxID=2672568 RepID=UPI0013DB7434|nr:cytochrome c [Sandarakinorhabdus rubra]
MRLAPLALLLLIAAAPPSRPLAVDLPNDEGLLPERYGVSADAANGNCLGCHSAAMITAQPRLSRVQWAETIAKMRTVYGAPIDPADDAAILAWLLAD